ncbi:hypothetical protein [Pseudoflavonifractor phocaeensis]|uniref:hypothetical protein n=1 Tax=Pseudoflavonifractor phocaeensis TaxID=1870988 RepID=UPI001958CCE1|nr:hypothetical protein [Pseudoflavonifractor phocaeensis]MBM6927458.1 hypothetical protein [Pseudoflavonifractor phocaeensis]
MATYTANYGLHQWVPEDVFVRTDFNTDLSKIDTALKTALDTANSGVSAAAAAQATADTAKSIADSKTAVVAGSYTGTGTENRAISLGFQPKAVLVERYNGVRYNNMPIAGLALYGKPCSDYPIEGGLTVTANGFTVDTHSTVKFNNEQVIYYYLAVR